MLSERLPLLPATLPDFRPCPPASDRAGWEALPLPARRRLLAAGEVEAARPLPPLPLTLWLDFTRSGQRAGWEAALFARGARPGFKGCPVRGRPAGDAERLARVDEVRVPDAVGLGQGRHRGAVPPGDGPEGVPPPDGVGLPRLRLGLRVRAVCEDGLREAVQVHVPPDARHPAVVGVLEARPAAPVAAGDVGL